MAIFPLDRIFPWIILNPENPDSTQAKQMSFIDKVTTLSIAIVGAASNSTDLDCRKTIQDAIAILLAAPAALDAVTYTILVSHDDGTTYNTLQKLIADGTLLDYPVPAAGKSVAIPITDLGGATHLKIRSGGASVAERVFTITKVWN